MGLFSWLRNAIGPDHSRRSRRYGTARKPALLSRLTLEALEDRCTPSTVAGLGYSTYLGSYDTANAIAVDSAGNAYVTGQANSVYSFPTLNAIQNHIAGGSDAFVAKFNAAGALVYATYLGGSGNEDGLAIAVDDAGNVYVTGQTTSTDFPTKNAFQPAYGGGTRDAFLTKLDPNGALLYSTYLGGSGDEDVALNVTSIAVDSAGDAYLSGPTNSTDFPTSSNALQPVKGPNSATYLTKLNTNLSGAASLVYSTYLNGEVGRGLAVDSSGAAYVAGNNLVTKLNPDASALVYSTSLGSATIYGIAVDGAGDAYLTGNVSTSAGFPITPSAYQTNLVAGRDAFVTELDATGSGVLYSTYLGGPTADARAIALDGADHVFVTGYATSGLPVKDAFQPISVDALSDAFVAEIDPSQSGVRTLVYSSFLGGSYQDYGYGIGVDGSGNAYVTGKTNSYDFPTVNALQTTNPEGLAAFVTKILPAASSTPTTTTLVSSPSPSGVGQSVTFTATVTATATEAGTPAGMVSFLDGSTELASVSLDAMGQATFTTTSLTAGSHDVEAVYFETATFAASKATVTQQVQQTQQASSTTLTSSLSPSTYGEAVTLTATVKAVSGAGTPTGTVTFLDGTTCVGAGTLNSKGVATLKTSALTAGSHSLTAVYNGDSTFAGTTAPALSQVVKQAATKTTLVSSLSKAPFGQPVTFTATVVPVAPGTGLPTGTLTFMDGNTVLGTITLSNGQATYTTSGLTKGKHTITASYNGDGDFITSTAAALTETIN